MSPRVLSAAVKNMFVLLEELNDLDRTLGDREIFLEDLQDPTLEQENLEKARQEKLRTIQELSELVKGERLEVLNRMKDVQQALLAHWDALSPEERGEFHHELTRQHEVGKFAFLGENPLSSFASKIELWRFRQRREAEEELKREPPLRGAREYVN